jgi:hypothetical protein
MEMSSPRPAPASLSIFNSRSSGLQSLSEMCGKNSLSPSLCWISSAQVVRSQENARRNKLLVM